MTEKIQSPTELHERAAALRNAVRPPVKLLVSMGTCGIAAGTTEVLKAIRSEVAERKLENAVEIVEVGCMGLCYAEPVIMLLDRESGKRLIYGDVTPPFSPRAPMRPPREPAPSNAAGTIPKPKRRRPANSRPASSCATPDASTRRTSTNM